MQLHDILKQEEILWCQKANLKWLKEGDGNTSFFHTPANFRRKCNYISNIKVNNSIAEYQSSITEAFSNFIGILWGLKLLLDLLIGILFILTT